MSEQDEITISSTSRFGWKIKELWQSRELLYFFIWRDVKVKYKQTVLGIGWSILQPLLLMLLSYFVFFKNLNIQTGINYPVFAYSGLILWGYFSTSVTNCSESLLTNATIIRKIYFPRIVIPIAAAASGLIDFLFALIILLVMCWYFNQSMSLSAILFFPIGLFMGCLSAFGIGTLLAALNIKFRDFRYLLPFLIQVLFFSSQTIYSIDTIKTTWLKNLLFINPINGALEVFRIPFYDSQPYWTGIAISEVVLICCLISGLIYFRKTENYFADLI